MLKTHPFLVTFGLALRNIKARRWRTLLTLMGIVLGVAVVLAIQITNRSTLDSIRQIFDRAAGRANLLVIPTNSRGVNALDERVLDRLVNEDGVEAAAPSLQVYTVLASEAGSFELNFNITGIAPGSMLAVFGIDPAVDAQVRVYDVVEGRLPEAGGYEVAIPEKYVVDKGYKLGDDLVIVSHEGLARLRIVGILGDDGAGLINDGAVAFTALEVVQDLFSRGRELDEIGLRIDPRISDDPRALNQLRESLSRRVGEEGRVIFPAARGELVPQMLATYQQGLAFFSLIAVFVGAFLIYNTFSMTVVERTREIGMLRAIGMSRFQVIRMVFAEAGLLAVAGCGLGLLAGALLARGLMQMMGAVVSADQNILSIPWQGLAQALLVGVGVTFGAAMLPALKASRISPLEALGVRGRTSDRVRPSVWITGLVLIIVGWIVLYFIEWRAEVLFTIGTTAILSILLGATLTVPLVVAVLEGFTRHLARWLYKNEGAIGSSNVRRAVGRTALTVASLMVALTMVIGIGSLAYSFEQDITNWIDTALGGDLYVRSPVLMRESFGNQLAAVPGVASVTPARYFEVRISPSYFSEGYQGDDILVFNAIEPDTYRLMGDVQFASGQGDPEMNWQRLSQGGSLFISTVVSDRFGISQGDEIRLMTRRGEQTFSVAAEIADFTGQGLVVVGTYSDMHRWFADRGVDRFTINIAPGYSVEEVSYQIESRYKDRRHISTQTMETFKEKIRVLMRQSFRLFDVLTMIGVIIGALGVINTLTMNVIERQREIGGLRSLGMTRKQILRMVLAESLALGIIGGIYGLGFGYLIAQILILGMNLVSGYDLVYRFTIWPFVIGVLIALLVSQIAALSPARAAAAVNIVEAIKHE
jgi:putative ABC transport system permease protein